MVLNLPCPFSVLLKYCFSTVAAFAHIAVKYGLIIVYRAH